MVRDFNCVGFLTLDHRSHDNAHASTTAVILSDVINEVIVTAQ